MKILLVEDHKSVAEGLIYSLEKNGYEVLYKKNFNSALAYVEQFNDYDLAIIDVMLGDGLGVDLYHYISKPIIFLTAMDDEKTIVECLEHGEYMNKPFKTSELLVRIKRLSNHKIIKVKELSYDLNKMEVSVDNNIIKLSVIELKILYILLENKNKVVTRAGLLNKIFEFTGNDVHDNTVTVYLKRIRDKLNVYTKEDIITTIKGIGYRIDE